MTFADSLFTGFPPDYRWPAHPAGKRDAIEYFEKAIAVIEEFVAKPDLTITATADTNMKSRSASES